jgi:hypothetical protein
MVGDAELELMMRAHSMLLLNNAVVKILGVHAFFIALAAFTAMGTADYRCTTHGMFCDSKMGIASFGITTRMCVSVPSTKQLRLFEPQQRPQFHTLQFIPAMERMDRSQMRIFSRTVVLRNPSLGLVAFMFSIAEPATLQFRPISALFAACSQRNGAHVLRYFQLSEQPPFVPHGFGAFCVLFPK